MNLMESIRNIALVFDVERYNKQNANRYNTFFTCSRLRSLNMVSNWCIPYHGVFRT